MSRYSVLANIEKLLRLSEVEEYSLNTFPVS